MAVGEQNKPRAAPARAVNRRLRKRLGVLKDEVVQGKKRTGFKMIKFKFKTAFIIALFHKLFSPSRHNTVLRNNTSSTNIY